ncbi:unnamed protein product [Mytilus edulis]|uniref:AIG1-type G domain-containing protein n=1 Tax=Mytilus edulis TaxID=6550 RepID=A0A8S3RW98_MYTED|nr:unnamed protein product [Mytilus edulis]
MIILLNYYLIDITENQFTLEDFKHGIHFKIVCTGICSAFSYSALDYSQSQTITNGVRKWYTFSKRQSIVKCQSNDETTYSTGSNNSKENAKPAHEDGSTNLKPQENELRIILLGATGSGKSHAGNYLLKKKKDLKRHVMLNQKQKTSLRTLTWEKDSKSYKIDIIDTPAYVDTGLTQGEVECEIKKAIALSAPGPHAFLVCIPATSFTECYEDVIEPYKQYFNEIADFIIVTITRYDQYKSERNKEQKQAFDHVNLHAITGKNENDIIILQKYGHEYETDDLINKILKSMDQRKNVFASCELSKHAEDKLQETIVNISKHPTIMDSSRDTVKMNPDFSKHFAQRCSYGD